MEADDEITSVRDALNQKAIAESSLSDNEDDDLVPLCPPPSSDPSSERISGSGGSVGSSSCSDDYIIHYGSDGNLPADAEIEVVGEFVSEKNKEGGIGRLERHVTVKSGTI